jgi:hypothetical protein
MSQPHPADDAAATIVPYKNPAALISYYCGVFSLIPCLALILAPVAIVLGIIGLSARKKNPQAHGSAHAVVGLVIGSITFLINVAVIILIVVAIANGW